MPPPLDHEEFTRWREQAAGAADTARLAREGGRYDWACFLCEQAAQLALKGLLHAIGQAAWGHDLVVLEARAREELSECWPEDCAPAAARLSRHYIPARYPDAHAAGSAASHYTAGDAEQAAADASALLAAVDGVWEELMREAG